MVEGVVRSSTRRLLAGVTVAAFVCPTAQSAPFPLPPRTIMVLDRPAVATTPAADDGPAPAPTHTAQRFDIEPRPAPAEAPGTVRVPGAAPDFVPAVPGSYAPGTTSPSVPREGDVPADVHVLPSGSLAVPEDEARASAAGGGTGLKWQLAPIRWGGNFAFEARSFGVEGEARRTQFVELMNIRGVSYIWQPWFIQVGGRVGFVLSQEPSGDGSRSTVSGTQFGRFSGDSKSLLGGLDVSVFPISRFPFLFTYDVTDSRSDALFTGSDYRLHRLGMRQSYRNPEGDFTGTMSFDRSTIDSSAFGKDQVDAFNATGTRSWETQRLQLTANRTENVRTADEGGSTFTRLAALHTYRPDELISVESQASLSRTRLRLVNNARAFGFDSEFRQVNSFMTWRPEEDSPLYVFASARVFESTSAPTDAQTARARSASFNLAANYRLNRNLSLYASGSIAQFDAGGNEDTLSTQGVGLSYVTDPIALGRWSYTATAGGNFLNQTGGAAIDANGDLVEDRQFWIGQLGHNISRQFVMSESTAWSLNLGQIYALADDTVLGESRTLAHTASLSWRYTQPSGLLAFTSLSFADSRTTGYNESRFQFGNLQVSGQAQFGPYSFANANLTVQATRQQTLVYADDGFVTTSSGGASFQHIRAFGVRRLRYTALFNAYNQQLNSRLYGDINAPIERITWAFEQRLDYTIGRLDFRASLRWAEIDGKKNALMFFRVNRQFGSF